MTLIFLKFSFPLAGILRETGLSSSAWVVPQDTTTLFNIFEIVITCI